MARTSRKHLTNPKCWCKMCRGGRDGPSSHNGWQRGRSRPFYDGGTNGAYSYKGPSGYLETFIPGATGETHRKTKACKEDFCGSCYEKAKGRNYC